MVADETKRIRLRLTDEEWELCREAADLAEDRHLTEWARRVLIKVAREELQSSVC